MTSNFTINWDHLEFKPTSTSSLISLQRQASVLQTTTRGPSRLRTALPELSHLSEDEAGGGGAAVRTLQPAASGVGPSVGLVTNKQ